MSNYILYPIIELKYYVITSIVALLMLTVLAIFLMNRKPEVLSRFGVQGLMLGRTRRQVLYMTLGLSELLFVVSMLIGRVHMEQVQIMLLISLAVLRIMIQPGMVSTAAEAVFVVLTGAALIAGNLLHDFILETGFDLYIFLVWLLLAVFIVNYCVFHLIKSIARMLEGDEDRKEKKKNNKHKQRWTFLREKVKKKKKTAN